MMAVNTQTRTIRLKLAIDGETAEENKATWKRLIQLNDATWKAANEIITAQYFNDVAMRSVYKRRGIDPKNMEAVAEVEQDFKQLFGTKRKASSEREIKHDFPELPSCITNRLNNDIVSVYNKEKQEVLYGRRSLRTYRGPIPIPTSKRGVEFSSDEDGNVRVKWKLERNEHIWFRIVFGRDKANYRLAMQRLLDGENDFSAPSIELRKDLRWYLLLPVKEPQRDIELDSDKSVGVHLGLSIPAYCALSSGGQRKAIGSGEDFLKARTQMQSRQRRLQRGLKAAHGGKGRKRKLQGLERVKEKERNFVRTYNHFVSSQVINFAVKSRAATIKLEMLEGYSKEDRSNFILRNWSYYELQEHIAYKARRNGINVVHIDPYHTSQTCSECGYYEPGQRVSQSEFKCASCGAEMNADYNAARNIAKSTEVVTKKEQTRYWKERIEEPAAKAAAAGHTAEE